MWHNYFINVSSQTKLKEFLLKNKTKLLLNIMKTRVIMKKLIKLSDTHYIIVDDSRKSLLGKNYSKYYLGYDYKIYSIDNIGNKPVIGQVTHSTEPLEGEFSSIIYRGYNHISLSEVEEAINGYSVEKMAENYTENWCGKRKVDTYIHDAFKAGFKAHQELVKDKLFTVEQVNNLVNSVTEFISHHEPCEFEEWYQKKLQKLLPKTEWNCIFDEQGKIKLI